MQHCVMPKGPVFVSLTVLRGVVGFERGDLAHLDAHRGGVLGAGMWQCVLSVGCRSRWPSGSCVEPLHGTPLPPCIRFIPSRSSTQMRSTVRISAITPPAGSCMRMAPRTMAWRTRRKARLGLTPTRHYRCRSARTSRTRCATVWSPCGRRWADRAPSCSRSSGAARACLRATSCAAPGTPTKPFTLRWAATSSASGPSLCALHRTGLPLNSCPPASCKSCRPMAGMPRRCERRCRR
mmetsp:Transcript_66450/g.216251  ORF Transcript_66450/g.216251 Transcript_66450/m.216251 type:complete len:237 (+) Transcript_66450:794-1504(+)